MMWALRERGVETALHYLDDFLVLGPPASPSCSFALDSLLSLCKDLGFPVADEKTAGPATCLTFLGIEIDSVACQIRLPKEKLEHLLSTVQVWMRGSDQPIPRYSSTKRELLSLVGFLSHAASVVHPGFPTKPY